MKNSNAWTFGIIFIGIFIFLAINNFELPKFFIGETKTVKGIIFETGLRPGIKGIGYYQEVEFFYSVNGNWYSDSFTVNNKYQIQKKGNNIVLKVSVSHPDRFKVLGFERTFVNEMTETFIFSENIDYSELKTINNLLFKTHFGSKGKIKKQEIGLFDRHLDTLEFIPIKIIDSLQNVQFLHDSLVERNKEIFIMNHNDSVETLVSIDDSLTIFKKI
jgi:hypothetical protein